MSIKKKISLFVLIAFGLTAPTLHAESMPSKVSSPEEAEAAYEMRSEFMKGMGGRMKAFSDFLKRGEGEPLELGSMATEIAENASQIPDLFPQDTGLAQNEDSEAKAEIWENWSDFVTAAGGIVEPAKALAVAFESGDPGEIGPKVKALGSEGCGGCHKRFRQKKE